MKVLITGGGGFLGFHLAGLFSKQGFKVIIIDVADFEKREYPKNIICKKIDIREKNRVLDVFREIKPDFVIHAAAALPLAKKDDIFSVNVGGTKNVLEASLKHKVKRVIYISSTSVYGVPKKHPIVESDQRIGVGHYGLSKIKAEDICFSYLKKGLDVTVLRPKTFLGSHRLGVFEILFDWIHDNRKIPVIGDGANRYQLLDVRDLCEAIYLITKKRSKKLNGVFNIAAKKFFTVEQDFNTFFSVVKSKSSVFKTPAFLVKFFLFVLETMKLSPLYKWIYDTADKDSFVSTEKLEKALGWSPKFSNSSALIDSYLWYRKNYDKIKSKPEGITHTVGWSQGVLAIVKRLM